MDRVDEDLSRKQSSQHPDDSRPIPIPLTLALPGWLNARLALVRQVQTPSSPLLDSLRSLSDEELRTELRRIEAAKTALETTATLIRTIMTWKATVIDDGTPVTVGLPKATEATNGERPSLRAGVLLVLSETQTPWKTRDLLDELHRRDWAPRGKSPRSQLEARLSKMVASGEIARVARGTYALAAGREIVEEEDHRVRDAVSSST
jgi:hypothetical protein